MAEVRIASATGRRRKDAAAKATRTVHAKQRVRKSGKDHGAMPTWRELESSENRRARQDGKKPPFLEGLSTRKFGLLLVLVAAAFTLYVGHVHSTDDLLSDVQRLRRENHRLHLKYNRLKGEFDRITGPAEIRQRARALGFVEGGVHGVAVAVPRPTD